MPKDKRKHIAVKPDTHEKFMIVAKLKDKTQDELIKYFIEKETK